MKTKNVIWFFLLIILLVLLFVIFFAKGTFVGHAIIPT